MGHGEVLADDRRLGCARRRAHLGIADLSVDFTPGPEGAARAWKYRRAVLM
jgi:hypothetical protein